MDRYKKLYDCLLENGELCDIFPELRRKHKENNWENDKNIFTRLQEEQEKALHTDFEE